MIPPSHAAPLLGWAWRLPLAALALLLGSCASSPQRGEAELMPPDPAAALAEARRPGPALEIPPQPTPAQPPADDRRFTLAFQEAPFADVLYALSQETDLNVTVEADVDLARRLTVHLKEVTFAQALEMVVVRGAGYSWRLEDGFLHITRFTEAIYPLDYLDVVTETDVEIGGDMLASSVQEAGVAGRFIVKSGRKAEGNGVWVNVERSLVSMMGEGGAVWIDRNVGLIHLRGSPDRVEAMIAWLDALKASLHREVFLEARILEVQLSRSHRYGIDWGSLALELATDRPGLVGALEVGFNGGSSLVLSGASRASGLIDFLETQGEVSLVSNPHLSVMNGQSAVMTVGYQFPFGDVDGVDRDPETGVTTFITSIRRAVLGLQLGISAQISAAGVVSLHIVPTLTRVQRSEDVEIPTTSSRTQTISNPVIDLQEMTTMVRVREGNTVVLGGLVSQVDRLDREGLPGLMRIPVLGALFGHTQREQETRELVIVITPYLKPLE